MQAWLHGCACTCVPCLMRKVAHSNEGPGAHATPTVSLTRSYPAMHPAPQAYGMMGWRQGYIAFPEDGSGALAAQVWLGCALACATAAHLVHCCGGVPRVLRIRTSCAVALHLGCCGCGPFQEPLACNSLRSTQLTNICGPPCVHPLHSYSKSRTQFRCAPPRSGAQGCGVAARRVVPVQFENTAVC